YTLSLHDALPILQRQIRRSSGRIRQKKYITFTFSHLADGFIQSDFQGNCIYTSGVFIFLFFSFSRRQCFAPIALMDKPPLAVGLFLLQSSWPYYSHV